MQSADNVSGGIFSYLLKSRYPVATLTLFVLYTVVIEYCANVGIRDVHYSDDSVAQSTLTGSPESIPTGPVYTVHAVTQDWLHVHGSAVGSVDYFLVSSAAAYDDGLSSAPHGGAVIHFLGEGTPLKVEAVPPARKHSLLMEARHPPFYAVPIYGLVHNSTNIKKALKEAARGPRQQQQPSGNVMIVLDGRADGGMAAWLQNDASDLGDVLAVVSPIKDIFRAEHVFVVLVACGNATHKVFSTAGIEGFPQEQLEVICMEDQSLLEYAPAGRLITVTAPL